MLSSPSCSIQFPAIAKYYRFSNCTVKAHLCFLPSTKAYAIRNTWLELRNGVVFHFHRGWLWWFGQLKTLQKIGSFVQLNQGNSGWTAIWKSICLHSLKLFLIPVLLPNDNFLVLQSGSWYAEMGHKREAYQNAHCSCRLHHLLKLW